MKQKHLYTLLLTFLVSSNVFSQFSIKQQRAAGGTDEDLLQSVWLTKDGGLVVGGPSASNISGEKTENSRGGPDYWIVKFKNTGALEWDKTIGGSSNDFLTSLQQTNDGGYILGGRSNSDRSFEKSENNRDSIYHIYGDYWVLKLDSLGNIEWDKTIGGSGEDYLTALQQTSDGGYILGGYSNSGISGEKTDFNRSTIGYPDYDYWIVKLDNLGHIEWDKTIGGISDDQLTSIQQTSDNGYMLGGYSISDSSFEKTKSSYYAISGGPIPHIYPTYDYWIVRLTGSGNIVWDKTIGGTGRDELYSLQQTNDKGFILGGTSTSNISGDKTENNRGYLGENRDYWAVKINSSGNIQWDRTAGGTGTDDITSVLQTKDCGYILGGYSNSLISGEKTENSRGSYDYWVVRLDKNGKIKADKTIGGGDADFLLSVKEKQKNKYVLSGYSYSKISGDKTQKRRGISDYWLVELKYNNSDSLVLNPSNENISIATKIKNEKFIVYPNPAKDMLHTQNTGKATFTLTNQSGKILFAKTINGNGDINVSYLPAGLYYLKNIETGEVQKIVITK